MKSKFYNIIRNFILLISLPLGGGLGWGCTEDGVDYTPAEPVAADNWGVYFAGSNSSTFPRSQSDTNVLEFTLKRTKTNGALTVPISLTVNNGTFKAPESATFADSADETMIEVTYEGLENGKLSATLSLPESFSNPYKIKDGFYKQSITVYEPILICEDIVVEHNSSTGVKHDIFGNVKSRITQVPGENHFFWENFLGSGITLAFKLDLDNGGTFDANDIKKCEGGIIPLNHAYDDGEYGWTFCVEEKPTDDSATPVTWTPEGAELGITESAYFYNYYGGSSYLFIDFWDDSYESGWGTIWSAVLDYSDGNQYDNYYFYLYY